MGVGVSTFLPVRGRQKTTLLGTIEKQLQNLCIKDFNEALEKAQDRDQWRIQVVNKS